MSFERASKSSYELYVGNLPSDITEAALNLKFKVFGPIVSLRIREGNRRGSKISFIRYRNQESVDLAQQNAIFISGNRLRTGPAFDKGRGDGDNEDIASDVGATGDGNEQESKVASSNGSEPASRSDSSVGRSTESQSSARPSQLGLESDSSSHCIVSISFAELSGHVFSRLRELMIIRENYDKGDEACDPILEAAAFVSGGYIFTSCISLLKRIHEVRERFKDLQMKLKSAGDNALHQNSAELEATVSNRNDVRRKLVQHFQEFLQMVPDNEELLAAERQIRTHLSALIANYTSELPETEEASEERMCRVIADYKLWKRDRHRQLEEARQRTEAQKSLAVSATATLHHELVTHSSSVVVCPWSNHNLDEMFCKFADAMKSEIAVAQQEKTADGVAIIQKALFSLVSNLRRQLQQIQHLTESRARFKDECKDLQPWLTKSPDLRAFLAASKSISGLKLLLRHLLIDYVSMREGGRESSEEFVTIGQGLERIRDQLQKQHEITDEQRRRISFEVEPHFPEMAVQHPELELESYSKFGGLVRFGVSLDQFKLTSMLRCSTKSVHKSTFCGRPIVVKEFPIPSQIDASESRFFESIFEYSRMSNPHLAQLVFLFFEMNDRQAVTLFPCYEFSLTQLMVDAAQWQESVRPEEVNVLSSVLQGVGALHEMQLIHAAIHPNNVLIDRSTGVVVVADYDFTKTPIQRAQMPFVTSSGLVFQAPELQLESDSFLPTYQTDMYNFGLLIVWIYKTDVVSVPSSHRELSSIIPDSHFARLATALLEENPTRRPLSADVLSSLPCASSSLNGDPDLGTASFCGGHDCSGVLSRQASSKEDAFQVGKGQLESAKSNGLRG